MKHNLHYYIIVVIFLFTYKSGVYAFATVEIPSRDVKDSSCKAETGKSFIEF